MDMSKLKNKLVSFCERHRLLYLYGAGQVGLVWLHVLRRIGFEPDGFLVTRGVVPPIEGVPVFSMEKTSTSFDDSTGIIATFKDATVSMLREQVGEKPDILLIPHPSIYSLVYDMALFSYLRGFGRARSLTERSEWKNILVIRLDVLGDLIMTTPFLRELRRNCPDSHITLVVRRSNELLFKNCPYISELVLYDCMYEEDSTVFDEFWKDQPYCELRQRGRAFAEKQLCRDRHYDIAFQPCEQLAGRGSVEALFISLYSGADVQVGRIKHYGEFDAYAKFIRSRWQEVMSLVSCDTEPRHEVLCMLDILHCAGARVQDDFVELWPVDSDREAARSTFPDFFDSGRTWVAVAPVGRTGRQCWPPDRYRESIERLCSIYGSRLGFVLLGGPDAMESAERVTKDLAMDCDGVVDLTGRTNLAQVEAIIEHCVMYLGADTGLKHMAAALRKPVVEISVAISDIKGLKYGIPEVVGAWQVDSIVLRAPHGLDDCTGNCAKTYPHCITQITVDAVVDATKEMLERIGVGREE